MGAFFSFFSPYHFPKQHNPVCGALFLRLGPKEDSKNKQGVAVKNLWSWVDDQISGTDKDLSLRNANNLRHPAFIFALFLMYDKRQVLT